MYEGASETSQQFPVSCTLGSGQRDETASRDPASTGQGYSLWNEFAMDDVEGGTRLSGDAIFWRIGMLTRTASPMGIISSDMPFGECAVNLFVQHRLQHRQFGLDILSIVH